MWQKGQLRHGPQAFCCIARRGNDPRGAAQSTAPHSDPPLGEALPFADHAADDVALQEGHPVNSSDARHQPADQVGNEQAGDQNIARKDCMKWRDHIAIQRDFRRSRGRDHRVDTARTQYHDILVDYEGHGISDNSRHKEHDARGTIYTIFFHQERPAVDCGAVIGRGSVLCPKKFRIGCRVR